MAWTDDQLAELLAGMIAGHLLHWPDPAYQLTFSRLAHKAILEARAIVELRSLGVEN